MQSTFGCLLLLSLIAIAVGYRSGPTRRLLVLEDLLGKIEDEQQRKNDDNDFAQYDENLSGDSDAYVDEDSVPVAPYAVQFVQDPVLAGVDNDSFGPIRVSRRMNAARYPIRLWSKRSGGVNFYGMRG